MKTPRKLKYEILLLNYINFYHLDFTCSVKVTATNVELCHFCELLISCQNAVIVIDLAYSNWQLLYFNCVYLSKQIYKFGYT